MKDAVDPGTADLFGHNSGDVPPPVRDPSMVGPARYLRSAADFYSTPDWVTKVIVRHVQLHHVWEPAAGTGAMSEVMLSAGIPVESTDLHDRGYGTPGVDFLAQTEMFNGAREIVTNPPYKGKLPMQFIEKALALTEPGKGRVVMVLRNEFDCAAGRRKLFSQTPFSLKIVLTKRPRWIAGSTGAPRHNYSIFVWDWRVSSRARIIYDA